MGVQWTYAPVADLSRDIRWGRIVEGFGEDPYLGSVLTAARVEGFRDGGLATAAKHFAGYGAPQGGRDYDTAFISRSEMHDFYLPPFRAAVQAGTVEPHGGLNALNGVPSASNPLAAHRRAARQWGFDGFVTADWVRIAELLNHGVAADGAEAARKAILAGVDMDMMGELYINHLPEEVRAGRVPESVVDEAVRRVLRIEVPPRPFRPARQRSLRTDAIFPSPESRKAAREVARETFVLLQNRGDVLPIGRACVPSRSSAPLRMRRATRSARTRARAHAQDSVTFCQGIRQRAERPASGRSMRPAATCSARSTDCDCTPR